MPGASFSVRERNAPSCCRSRHLAINTHSAAITRCCQASCCSSWRWRFSPRHPLASEKIRRRLDFVLGVTVPLTICASAWMLPLQAIIIGSWKAWERRASGNWDLYYLVAGAAIGLVLLLPFLAGIAGATGHMKLQLVQGREHTPLGQFLLVFWPLLVLALAVPLVPRVKPLAGFLAAVFLLLLALSELFNAFDGGYTGDFLRFNSALKWWGWIFTGGVFSISACLLASDRIAVRIFAAGVIVLISAFAWDSGRLLTAHGFSGKIDGTGFYAQDPANGRMMEYLARAPRGVVLEKLYDDERPNDTGIYGSFAQKPNLIGIPWVLRVWKRNLTELPALMLQINNFFAGTHPQAARFLLDHDIRYVVWSARESKDLEKWRSIMASIDDHYSWMEFSDAPDSHIGALDSPLKDAAVDAELIRARKGVDRGKEVDRLSNPCGWAKHCSRSPATLVDG